MERDYLSCVEIEPGTEARAAIIWLHGLGADGHDFEPIVPHLGLDDGLRVRFVFPHAPRRAVTINAGMIMHAWYDIRTLTLKREIDEEGVQGSADLVQALVERENERGIPSERIVMAGFSQGGAIALHLGLRHRERFAGILALSTYLVCAGTVEAERGEANLKTPIFQAHGLVDPMVPLEYGEQTRARLSELGYSVEWRTYPVGHAVHPDEAKDVGVFLGRVLAG